MSSEPNSKDLSPALKKHLEELARYVDVLEETQVIQVLLFKIYQRLESIDLSLDALVENSVDEFNERHNK